MNQVLFSLLVTTIVLCDCGTITKPLTKLLVVSGYPVWSQNTISEVIDLSNSSMSCQSWADHPMPNTYDQVGELINDKLLICGGVDPNGPTDTCFEIGPSSAEATMSLKIGSTSSASVSINGSLFVAGGISMAQGVPTSFGWKDLHN